MRVQQPSTCRIVSCLCRRLAAACGLAAALLVSAPTVQAAINWDGGGNSPWWFDTANWNSDWPLLPPMQVSDGVPNVTDALLNPALPGATWDQGEGVVFDPATDPNYAASFGLTWIGPYGPHAGDPTWGNAYVVNRLYMARGSVANGVTISGTATLTIRGVISTSNWLNASGDTQDSRWQIGRDSGVSGVPADAVIIQESGTVINNYGDLDLGSNDSSGTEVNCFGNGTWDYRGGTLEQGFNGSATTVRLRLSTGGSTGVGGIGTFIMRNPGSDAGGHVRVEDFQVAPFSGENGHEPNGTIQGVGIAEFHALRDGTRPIQVTNGLTLANGGDAGSDPGIRSSRLRLVLDEAPMLAGGVPINLGLFDIDSDGNGSGSIAAYGGQTVNDYGLTFSNADAADPLATSAVYDNLVDAVNLVDDDNIVTAMFGASTFRWRIYYDGNITWSDYDNSVVANITGPGTGRDLVLIGLDARLVPEPSALVLAVLAIGLLARRRRR
jgi:hypothetical protein